MTRLEEIAEDALKDADLANNYFHTQLAIRTAEYLCEKEGADFDVIKASLLIHHIAPRRAKNSGISDYRTESLQKGKEILSRLEFPQEMILKILNCVESTYFGKELIADNINAKVAHDANKLVTMGALAIARSFTFGGYFKRPIYDPEKSLIKSKDDVELKINVKYDPYAIEPDTISHFKTKLLQIKDKMLTNTGKELAKNRHTFMVEFLYQFFDEININNARRTK